MATEGRGHTVRLRETALGVAAAILSFQCAGDEPTSYTVSFSASDDTPRADGAVPINLSVSVVDQDGRPAPFGEVIAIVCQAGATPFGVLAESTIPGQAQAVLTAAGVANLSFRCSGDPTTTTDVQCVAAYERETAFVALRCTP